MNVLGKLIYLLNFDENIDDACIVTFSCTLIIREVNEIDKNIQIHYPFRTRNIKNQISALDNFI